VARHSEAVVSDIKHAIDLVTLLGEYLPLQRVGSKYKALCPFHDDHNPSLELNPERQSFKCWVCGAGGDIFDFVQKYERVDFPEALRMLADRAGVTLQSQKKTSGAPCPSKADLLEACAWAEKVYAESLAESDDAWSYVSSRGFHRETIDRFRLGYAPDRPDWLIRRAQAKGIPLATLDAAGLTSRSSVEASPRDRFRGRLIFPIHDGQGRAIAFGGRILPAIQANLAAGGHEAPKYLNSPETALFQKRRHLYGAPQAREAARQAGWVGVVEGYTDVLAAHQVGIASIVGTLGTAVGEEHIQSLRRLSDRVVLVFDGDEAGQKAAERALELFLGHEIELRVLALPAGIDPCDSLLAQGRQPFLDLVEHAVDPLEFALLRARARFELDSPEGTRLASEWLLSLLARVPRSNRSGLDIKLGKALDLLAQQLRLPVRTLSRRLRSLRISPRRAAAAVPVASKVSRAESESPTAGSAAAEPVRVEDLDRLDRDLLRIALNAPALVPRLADRVSVDDVRHPAARRVLEVCYELHAQGVEPSFDRVAHRVDEAERSLAAGLLLPLDRQPHSSRFSPSAWVREVPWEVQLESLLPQIDERRWLDRLAALQRAISRLNPVDQAEEYQSLRYEFLKLHQQRPETRKNAAT
jgi:DNA primase